MANYDWSIENIFPWDVRIGLTTQLLLRLSMDRESVIYLFLRRDASFDKVPI